jgi:hypothetical protein
MILLGCWRRRRCATMMGKKIRNFVALPTSLSLEELVPKDNFYRRLDRKLDLTAAFIVAAPEHGSRS